MKTETPKDTGPEERVLEIFRSKGLSEAEAAELLQALRATPYESWCYSEVHPDPAEGNRCGFN